MFTELPLCAWDFDQREKNAKIEGVRVIMKIHYKLAWSTSLKKYCYRIPDQDSQTMRKTMKKKVTFSLINIQLW